MWRPSSGWTRRCMMRRGSRVMDSTIGISSSSMVQLLLTPSWWSFWTSVRRQVDPLQSIARQDWAGLDPSLAVTSWNTSSSLLLKLLPGFESVDLDQSSDTSNNGWRTNNTPCGSLATFEDETTTTTKVTPTWTSCPPTAPRRLTMADVNFPGMITTTTTRKEPQTIWVHFKQETM